jgi:transposase
LLPLEAVDEVVDRWPRSCGCGRPFAGDEREPICEPARHRVGELPEIAVRVTEHRLDRLRCPDCGASARAELPAEVPAGAFGPRLEAAVATLAVRNRVSRRDTVELLDELFGARLSSGTVDAILGRAAAALDEPHEDLLDHIRCAPAVNIDETGWRLKGKRRTLWGAATPAAAVFRIAPDRHEREALALLGEDFEGVVGSDRWWAYRGFDPGRRQVCWSHLIRDFTAHAEGLAAQREFGERGLDIARRLFCADEFQADGDRRRLKRKAAPLKRELKALLRRGSKGKRHKHTRGFSKNLLKVWPALWTFTEIAGRRADQQPGRARAARTRHPPQALSRQPVRARPAHHRAPPLGLRHLPPTAPLAVRLPDRRAHRHRPRSPRPIAGLSVCARGTERLPGFRPLQEETGACPRPSSG